MVAIAAHPSGEPTADAELQRPAAAALANLCSEVSLAERLVQAGGMQALAALSQSHDRQVQVRLPSILADIAASYASTKSPSKVYAHGLPHKLCPMNYGSSLQHLGGSIGGP